MLSEMFDMFVQSFWETLVMVGISGLVGAALGLAARRAAVSDRPRRRVAQSRGESRHGRRRQCRAFDAVYHSAGRGDSVHAAGGRFVDRHAWRPSCR